MVSVARRRAAVGAAAFSLALTGPAALAAQSVLAAPPPATQDISATQDGLLDPVLGIVGGLTATLNTLLSGTGLTNLTSLTSALNGGAPATSTALAPVQTLLGGLAVIPGLDPPASSLLAQVNTLAGAGGASSLPLPVSFLQPVAAILGGLAQNGQGTLSAGQLAALTDLQAAIAQIVATATATTPTAGLPIGSLSLDPAQVSSLTTLLGQLQGGTASSPQLLAPVASLLTSVASTPGLPAPVAEVINTVAGQLAGASSLTGLLAPVGQLLKSIGATPGVPAPVADLLGSLAGLLGSSGSGGTGAGSGGGGTTTTPTGTGTNTPAPTTPGAGTLAPGSATGANGGAGGSGGATANAAAKVPAKLKSVRFDRKRGRIVMTLSCPAGKGKCTSLLFAMNGTRSVTTPVLLQLADGGTAVRNLRLDAKSRRALKEKALKLIVYAATSKTQITTRSLKIAKAKAAKKNKRAAA